MQKVIDLVVFQKVHQPETLAPNNETRDPVDDDLIFDTDDSDEGEDEDEDEDLGGFVVADDEVDDGSSASEAAPRKSPADKTQKKKEVAKKDPKGKGKEKVRSPPRTLAEVRKDAMRNAKSKKQCMCLQSVLWGLHIHLEC